MPHPHHASEHVKLLYCPFCGRGFEDRIECPEHELELLSIDELRARDGRPLDQVSFFFDPRLGRGPVLLGAVLVLVGFVAPFVRSRGLELSALRVAIDGADNLWLAPGAAILLLWIAWSRRSSRVMQAARAAVFGLAVGGAFPLIYTTRRIVVMADASQQSVDWSWGLWLMLAGLAVCALGSAWFGGRRPAF